MSLSGWVRRILERISDEIRRDLADELATAIELHFGLIVTPSSSFAERGARGWCDGVSIIDAGMILYRRTDSRRENFTLMHELGHHLVAADDDCLSWLADQPDPAQALEQLCDHIAAALLITADDYTEAAAGEGSTAGTLVRLYDNTHASRSACAVTLARRLPCDGFVTLVQEGTQEVFFTARSTDTTRPYPWRGDALPPAHPLRWDPPPERTKAWWPYPSASDRREYFMSTAVSEGWRFAVFAVDNLWNVPGFHLPQVIDDDRGNDQFIRCPCGYRGKTRMWPCSTCGVPECPKCHECECARRARREPTARCQGPCMRTFRVHLLEDGYCEDCR